MNAVEFLQAILPRQGIYALSYGPFFRPGSKKPSFRHPYDTSIPALAAKGLRISENDPTKPAVYMVIHSITEVIQKSFEGQAPYPGVSRERQYMKEARCFYGDLDTAKPKDTAEEAATKYATQQEGWDSLVQVCKDTGFPMPIVVNSGRGWHLYWLIEDEIPSEIWAKHAKVFDEVMKHAGLKLDGGIAFDPTHVLRLPGTWWRKPDVDPEPRKVRVQHVQETRQPNAEFLANVYRLQKLLPEKPQPGERAFDHDSTDKPSPKAVAEVCPTFKAMVAESLRPDTRGTVWLNVNTIALHTTGGPAFAHTLARNYADYDVDETQGKLDSLIEKKIGPTTCGVLDGLFKPSHCLACKFNPGAENKGTSPVAIARRRPTGTLPEEIPEPGGSYLRTARGIEQLHDGKPTIICPYVLYPTGILDEEDTRTKSTGWTAVIPRRGNVTFNVPATCFNDPRTLNDILANQSIYLSGTQLKKTGEFMSHYIRLLQQHQEERKQYTTQGWNKEHTECLVGDTLYTKNGPRKVDTSKRMVNIIGHLQKKGTLQGQVETMKFYEHPDYVQQQFMIGVSIGAVLMFMTNYFGVIVNFSGDTGVAKSTVVTAGASMWGNGEKLLMNGTAGGMTANAKAGRIAMYANIPAFLDEITLMEQGELREMTMGISQVNPIRVRNKQDGTEREIPDTQKATVLICTSNQSPHDQLSQNSLAGSAGSARIFNAHTQMTHVHTKTQADAFIRALRDNYGHIGPEVVMWAIHNMDAVRAELKQLEALVDRVAKVRSSERYWPLPVVLSTLALRICKRLGLLNYDDSAVLAWGVQQIIEQREVVAETYADPVDVMHNYIQSTIINTLLLNPQAGGGWYIDPDKKVQGVLKARYELGSDTLYTSTTFFKEYCDSRKIPHSRTQKALIEMGVARVDRVDLTRGVPSYPRTQASVLVVNLKHVKMAGYAPIEDTDGKVVQLASHKKVDLE